MGSEVWRQRQEGLHEFEAQQGQKSKFKASWDDTEERCLKTKQTKSPEVGWEEHRVWDVEKKGKGISTSWEYPISCVKQL